MREVKTESIADNLEEYVKAAAGGDQEAFEALYHYSYRIVAAECYEVLHSALDVEDAVQDTHLRIFRNLDKLKDPNKFLGWCRTIAHNQSITIVTREKNKNGKDDLRPPVSDETAIGMDALDSEDLDSSPTDELEQELIKKYLQSAIDTLSADRMMCLAMHQQGYTYQQISDETAIPLGTVKSSMHYAKKQLAKAVERIEKESGIKLHAFTLVPVAGHVVPKLESEEGGWISARSEAGAAGEESTWNAIAKKLPGGSASAAAGILGTTARKILAVILAAIVVAGGVIAAVYQSDKKGSGSTPNFTQVTAAPGESGVAGEAGQAIGQGNLNARNSQAITATQNADRRGAGITQNNNQPQPSPEPQTTAQAETTRKLISQTVRRQDDFYNNNN